MFCFFSEFALAANLRSFSKDDYMTEDTNTKGLEPNVLFLLDTSTAMTFTVNGVMPNIYESRSNAERAKMLKDSTYGQGMRPPQFDGVETTLIKGGYTKGEINPLVGSEDSYSRYGRDLIEADNRIGDPYCYYTSDPSKPFLLTFRNRHLAHYTSWISSTGRLSSPSFSGNTAIPNSGVVGKLLGSAWQEALNEASRSYNALYPYIPKQWEKDRNGNWVPTQKEMSDMESVWPVPSHIANEHLVPNDSRLYKMKLALWRLTDQINSHIFSRMNVGVAITYQDISTAYMALSVATKNAALNAIQGQREYFGATRFYEHGVAAPYVIGNLAPSEITDINGKTSDNAYMSQRGKRGVLVDLYGRQNQGDDYWNAMSRAIMYVPFDKFYMTNPDNPVGDLIKTNKLNYFRNYISGYEHYKSSYREDSIFIGAENRPVKDEFWASSLTLLSTAIYGGRDRSEGGYFPYHKGRTISNTTSGVSPTNEPMIQFAVTSKDNAGSTEENIIFLDPLTNTEGHKTGHAIGSALDFFSPPDTNSDEGLDGVKYGDNTVGFFPVTGSCQSNWLIVFSSGHDAVKDYSPAEAVRKLFHKTREMRGRYYNEKDSKWEEKQYEMDSGVRTLVVGLINPDNMDPEVQRVSGDLKAMAKAGDPVWDENRGEYVDNPDAVPEIATNAEGLEIAFGNVLKRINADRMGSGTVSMAPVIDEITEPDNAIPGSRIVFGASYRINPLDQWSGWLSRYTVSGDRTRRDWEANEEMVKIGLNRSLWVSRKVSGSASQELDELNANVLRDIVPAGNTVAFNNWLRNYDGEPVAGNSIGVLGDMINSGITVVGAPILKALRDNIAINNRNAIVYVQTNRGVLHALNYSNGIELWGFIPPNIFQHKLRNIKFNGNTYLGGNALTRVRSNPMVLLDGMLIARDCVDGNSTRTLLTGYLGHGGNGFYTMDITSGNLGSKPSFEWAIENARYSDTGEDTIAGGIKRWGRAGTGNANLYDYRDLGLTVVPGVYFTVADGGPDTVGVLPGGLGHNLGADSHGKAFYFFNPSNGSIIDKIDTFLPVGNRFLAPTGRTLGMGVSPIIYQENGAKNAIAFYTADSEGNIISCDVKGKSPNQWNLQSIFQLRTVGDLRGYENGATVTPPARGLPVAIPRKMILARARTGQLWLFGGTSDLYAPGSDGDESKRLINKEQFIFGLNVKNILASDQLNSGITPAAVGRATDTGREMRFMDYYEDDIPVKYGRYGRGGFNFDENSIGIEHGMDDYGWILRLRPKFGVTDAEYLSADPFLMNNALYFATFIPNSNSMSDEACSDIGVAKLYVIDPSTGLSAMQNFQDKPAIVLENIKIAGITGDRRANSLIISIKELKTDAKKALFLHGFSEIGDNLFQSPQLTKGAEPLGDDPVFNFEPLIPSIQYWREMFR